MNESEENRKATASMVTLDVNMYGRASERRRTEASDEECQIMVTTDR